MTLYAKNTVGQRVRGILGAADAAFLGKYTVTPAASTNTAVHAAIALTASAQPAVTTGITNPDVPRVVLAKGNASGNAGNVVITGTDILGNTITDTIALSGTSAVAGVKAFATVTSIALPAETHAGTDTVSIGTTDVLGLPVALAANTILDAYYGGAKEGTAPTVTVSSTVISQNTFDLNTALAGAAALVYFYV